MTEIDYIVSRINTETHTDVHLLNHDEWISEPNAHYPIELELLFRKLSNVEKLLITCHNYYIPEGLELVCNGKEGEKSLGEVKFKKNKSLSSKHEMKTVYLDEACSSLVLRILGCYDMDTNPENQVGLVNVKIIGKALPDAVEHEMFENWEEKRKVPTRDGRGRYSEELDKLAKIVEANKLQAVTNENFPLAKQAQIVQRTLKKAKKEVFELERDMKEAIDEEDYQRAKDLQDEIKSLRANILSSIDSKLIEENPVSNDDVEVHRPKNLFSEEITEFPPHRPKLYTPVDLSPTEVHGTADLALLPPRPPASSSSIRSTQKRTKSRSSVSRRPVSTESVDREKAVSRKSLRGRPISAESLASNSSVETLKINKTRRKSTGSSTRSERPKTNKFMEKENMIVPAALKGRSLSNMEINSTHSEDQTEEDLLNIIPSSQKGLSSKAVACFGTETVAKIFSKQWQKKLDSIAEVREKLENMNADRSVSDYIESTIYVLNRVLNDSLYNVYSAALDLLSYFTIEFIPKYHFFKCANRLAKATCDQLIRKANDCKDKRAPQITIKEFVNIITSDTRMAKAYLPILISTDGMRADRGRVLMVDQALNHYEVPNDEAGLNERIFRKFSTGCLVNGDPEVRTLGKKFFLKLYTNGERPAAKAALPNGTILRKSPLFRSLLEEIRQIDNMKKVPPSILKNVRIME